MSMDSNARGVAEVSLLPCPFCGGKGESSMTCSEDGGMYVDRWAVNCRTCNFEVIEMAVDGDEPWYKTARERSAAKWNTRVNSYDALQAENRRLREALIELMTWGVELDDERLSYIVAQVDKGAIEDARRALRGEE